MRLTPTSNDGPGDALVADGVQAAYDAVGADVVRDIEAAGFTLMSTVVRQPWPGVEYPSRRCYLLARRR